MVELTGVLIASSVPYSMRPTTSTLYRPSVRSEMTNEHSPSAQVGLLARSTQTGLGSELLQLLAASRLWSL